MRTRVDVPLAIHPIILYTYLMATLWQQKSSKPRKMQIIEIKRIRKYTKIKQISLIETTTLSGMNK